eukprot:TRINITY_DN4078_c0_g1_i1.p1 TRINITY_DN4078_c0_g1~~TRINITY_DN4078_c0_g1_i1.p1  ORF type:complete len:122 (+),score=21.42 TRINITY_DN4078_c0_g1_i1:26-391(+)
MNNNMLHWDWTDMVKDRKMELFSSGLCAAPLEYIDFGDNDKKYNMKLIAGFVGVEQCKTTLEIVPMIGWMIGNEKIHSTDVLKNEQLYAAEYEWTVSIMFVFECYDLFMCYVWLYPKYDYN